MSENARLNAEPRDRFGKGGARELRRNDRVPAIVYGGNEPPMAISLNGRELQKQFRGPGFFSRVFELNVDGEAYRVLPRDLQTHPVNGHPLHLDFMRFSATTRFDVDVDVVFENEDDSPGLKKGAMLNIVLHTVSLSCLADHIPESIKVDLTGLEVGDTIHIKDLVLPKDVQPVNADTDAPVATIAAPTVAAADEEEGEEEEADTGAEHTDA